MAIVWVALFAFMPKQAFYYRLEQVLQTQGFEMSGETLDEGIFSFSVKHPSLYIKGVKVATVDQIDLFSLLFYTTLKVQDTAIDSSLRSMAPEHIGMIKASYTILSPFGVSVWATGDFGTMEGVIDLKNRKVRLDLVEEKEIAAIRSRLLKDEKGWYYEASF